MSGSKTLKSCVNCSQTIEEHKQFCVFCGFDQKNLRGTSSDAEVNTLKPCVNCGKMIEAIAQFCGYCSYDQQKDQVSKAKNRRQFSTQTYPKYSQPTSHQPSLPILRNPIYWKHGYKIIVGGVLFAFGASSIFFSLFFFGQINYLVSDFLFIYVVIIGLFGILPIFIGYKLLKEFMIFVDMIKMTILFAITAYVTYSVGFILILIIIFFVLGYGF